MENEGKVHQMDAVEESRENGPGDPVVTLDKLNTRHTKTPSGSRDTDMRRL